MNTTPHICLLGRAGAGKSTVARLLMERFDLGHEHLSFAAPLKAGCATQTDREILQRVGAGVRELFPDFWVNLALAEMEERNAWGEVQSGRCPQVVDDCRYWNEYYALLEKGFRFIRVTAPESVRIARLQANGKLGGDLNAESETQLDDALVEHTITNPGNEIEDVMSQLVPIITKLRI